MSSKRGVIAPQRPCRDGETDPTAGMVHPHHPQNVEFLYFVQVTSLSLTIYQHNLKLKKQAFMADTYYMYCIDVCLISKSSLTFKICKMNKEFYRMCMESSLSLMYCHPSFVLERLSLLSVVACFHCGALLLMSVCK